jgi:hypothetical protein
MSMLLVGMKDKKRIIPIQVVVAYDGKPLLKVVGKYEINSLVV